MNYTFDPVKNFVEQKRKVQIYSVLTFLSCVAAPLSFSFLTQQKIHPLLPISFGLFFVFLVILFTYLKSVSSKNIEYSYEQLKAGMRIKRKQSAGSYEIIQESPKFFYLKNMKDNQKVMISKERIKHDYEIDIL